MKKEIFLVLILVVGGGAAAIWTLFGGSGGNKVYEHDSEIGFVEQLVNTGGDMGNEIGVVEVSTDIAPDKIEEIRFMMPSYFYTSGWKKFAQDLLVNRKIHIKFLFVDNLTEYRDSVSEIGFDDADLILIPYDRLEKVPAKNFKSPQDLQPAFDSLVDFVVAESNLNFLPFAADPLMMYALSGYLEWYSFKEIGDLAYSRSAPRSKSFPLFFGLSDADYLGQGFDWEYKDIVWYALMHYFTTRKDLNNLSIWIDNSEVEGYSDENLGEIMDLIEPTFPNCSKFPSICFQLYKFVGVRFGFLSDRDIVSYFFPSKKNVFLDLYAGNLPLPSVDSSFESPIRLRGLVIPDSLKDIRTFSLVCQILEEFLRKHDEYYLWGSTLSVFEGSNLSANPKVGMRGYILSTGGNFIKDMSSNDRFWKLFRHQISVNDYLK